MSTNFDIVHRFAKKLQTRVIIQRVLFFYLLSLSLFFVFTCALNALFFFSPLLMLPLIWDCGVIALPLHLRYWDQAPGINTTRGGR
jgi:hypothetical protein